MLPSIAEAVEHLELVSDALLPVSSMGSCFASSLCFAFPSPKLHFKTAYVLFMKSLLQCALSAFLYRKCEVVEVRAQSVELAGYEMNE